jgi:hypothetical protein
LIDLSGREKRHCSDDLATVLLRGLYSLFVLCLLTSCGQNLAQPESGQTTRVGIDLKLPIVSPASDAAFAGPVGAKAFQSPAGTVTRLNISVTDTNNVVLISTSIDVASDTGEVTVDLDVPAGIARIFVVEALDKDRNVLFRGQSDSTDLEVGVPKTISIQMVQIVVPPPPPPPLQFNLRLQGTLSDLGSNFETGKEFEYELTVTNITPSVAPTDVVLTLTVPAGLTNVHFLDDDGVAFTNCVQSRIQYTCPLGSGIPEMVTLHVRATASAPGDYILSSDVTSSDVDSDSSDNHVDLTAHIVAPPPIILFPSVANVPKGQTQTFTITGANPSEVDWLVNGVKGGNTIFGTISTGGTYTPPAIIPVNPANTPIGVPLGITVEAAKKTDPQINGSATVILLTGPKLTFDSNFRVSRASGLIFTDSAGQRGIAFYKGMVYAVWYAFDANGATDIFFAESGDGTKWTPTSLTALLNQSQPSIAVGPDGSIYIAFLGQVQSCSLACFVFPAIEVLVRRPGDTGFSSFTSQPLMVGGTLGRPSVSVSPKGVVFVSWSALVAGSNYADVYLSRIKGDGTLIDSIPKNLTSSDSVDEQNPVVAVGPDGDVFLGYELNNPSSPSFIIDSFVRVSLDGGNTFLPAVQVNPVTAGNLVTRLTLAPVSGGVVHIAWEEDTCGDGCTFIAYSPGKVSQDNGGNFSLTVDPGVFLGNAVKAVRQTAPSIASDGFGGVYIGFRELVSGTGDEIFLAKTTDDGKTFAFSPISQDSGPVSTKADPSLAIDSAGRSFATWTDNRFAPVGTGNTDVLFSKGE